MKTWVIQVIKKLPRRWHTLLVGPIIMALMCFLLGATAAVWAILCSIGLAASWLFRKSEIKSIDGP